MIVVSDSSPLITLAKIDCLRHLQALFGTIHIPIEIEQEIKAKGPAQGVPDVINLMQGWLIVQKPSTIHSFPGLHPGEAAAISLAIEQSARLLIDEKAGRKVAATYGVAVVGTVGILEELAERRLINLSEAFDQLKATNFRFPSVALDTILKLFEEQRSKAP